MNHSQAQKDKPVGTFSAVWYGECRNSQGSLGTDKLFTGQRLDDTGLCYYGARYYDAEIGARSAYYGSTH